MATITVTPGWAGPLSAVSSDPIVLQVAGVGPQGSSGVAPSGTGIVTVTSGVLGTPGPLTGDVTTTAGGLATTLATVNSNVGSFTNASITVDAKGRVTAASTGGGGGGTWGSITGTLSAQTDLQNALDAKQAADADLTSWAAVTRASGFDTFTATPSSANLAALLTDETGSGAAVFATSPTLVTPALGTPSSLVLTNATSLPDSALTSNVPLKNAANTFTAAQTVQVQSATAFVVKQATGGLVTILGVDTSVSNQVTVYKLTTTTDIDIGGELRANAYAAFNITNPNLRWPSNSPDVILKRTAARVLHVTDGSSGSGWMQNSAGRSRVTSDVTNTGTTLAAITGLSVTVIAGRKYAGRMVLWLEGSVTAAEGFQLDFNGGSATWTSFRAAIVSNVQGATLVTTTSKNLSGLLYGTAFSAIDTQHCIVVEWAGVCNAAGTLIPRIAKNTTGGGSTLTVSTNSNMPVEDYP